MRQLRFAFESSPCSPSTAETPKSTSLPLFCEERVYNVSILLSNLFWYRKPLRRMAIGSRTYLCSTSRLSR